MIFGANMTPQKSTKPLLYTWFWPYHQDKIGCVINAKLILGSKNNKRKAKRKQNTPHHVLCSAKAKEKGERQPFHQENKNTRQNHSLNFSLFVSRPNSPLTQPKAKTHLNKKESKDKQEKRRRKEEGGASKQVYLQELHQTQVYHVHNAISKLGVSNLMP